MASSFELSPNDLSIVLNEVTSMSPSNVVNFGLQLNITRNVIESFEICHNRDMKQCLREILNECLKQEPPLTWPDIVTALRADCVGESRLAREIEARHMPSCQPPSSGSPQPERAEASLTPHPQILVSPQPSVQPVSEELSSSIREVLHPPHNPTQYLSPIYHPPYDVPQYHGSPFHRYPLTLPLANMATCSRSHVQATVEPPAAKRARLQPPVAQPQAPNTSVIELFHKFMAFVKNKYKLSEVERDPNALKWPPTPSRVYINLACIDRKVSGLKSLYDEITEAMVYDGNVDVVHGGKSPIDMNEIAKGLPVDTLEKIILVEGAPGVGKSTFAWEYCRRWERGEIAQQYQLVLLLRLRDDRTSRAKTLRDVIQHYSEDVCQAVCNELESTLGVNTMIILEGFDELSNEGHSTSSVFMQLIHGQLLPLATVMVTSRPWATHILFERCSYRIFKCIEILGFTRQQISEYIESVLPDSEARRDLETYINRHPQISAGMYIPLNSAIVVIVYQESQGSGCPMPTTLTELYTAIVRTLLVRYLLGHLEYDINIQRYTDLPPAVYAKFLKLCEVAYNGIVGTTGQVKLIFSEHDLPADFDNLGFMDSVTELYQTQERVSSHNFLHVTFQEFFAAVHISNMSPAQQLEHFQSSGFRGGLGEESGDGSLKVVLRFLAGLTKLHCISKYAVNNFSTRRKDERNQLSCDVVIDTNLVNWMFETQSDDVIASLMEQKRIGFFFIDMLPIDYYSLGYCIAHSQCQWVLRVEEEEKLDEERVRTLAAGASTSDGGQGGKIVRLEGEVLTEYLNMIFTEWKSILQLHQLSLMLWVPCDEITWPDLSELRILILTIRSCTVKLDSLLPHLSLESLTVTGDEGRLEYEDCVAIENHLINASTLKHVSISDCECNASGLLVLARALHDHPTLQEKKLERLCISLIEGDDEVRGWAQLYIEYPNMVNWTDLVKVTGISDAGAVALARTLHHNSTLTKLNLSNNSISYAGAVALAQALHCNSTLTKLNLSNNSISYAGAVALAQALHHNSTLTALDMSNSSVSDAGAVALAQALHHNSTLTALDMSNSSVSDAGAVALAQALHHNSILRELDLTDNDGIGEEGVSQVVYILALRVNTECKLNLPRRYEEYTTPPTTSSEYRCYCQC